MRAVLIAVSLIVAAPLAAQGFAPFEARELRPGIRLLATPEDYVGPAISNVTVIEQSDGHVVIDSGATAGHGRAIAAYVRSLGAKPVKAVLITHWHNDHPLGVSELRRAWPRARVIATATTARHLTGAVLQGVGRRPDEKYDVAMWNQVSQSRAQYAAIKAAPDTTDERRARVDRASEELQAFARSYPGTHIVPPNETFTDLLELPDAERPVQLRFLGRANTDGDAIAWLPRQRIVVTGDVVVAPAPFGFFSFPADWLQVIARLKALDFTLLVPGHGAPQPDSAYLDKLSAAIADMRDQVGPLARQGLSIEEVRRRTDFSKQAGVFTADPRLKRAFDAYWLTPMVVNAWLEARGEPMVQGDPKLYR